MASKARRRRRLRIATGIVVVAAAVWWAAFLHRCSSAERALQSALSELAERGEPGTLKELMQKPQRQPNGAPHVMRAVLRVGGWTAALLPQDEDVQTNVRILCGEIPEIGSDSRVTAPAYMPVLGGSRSPLGLDQKLVLAALPAIKKHLRNAVSLPPGRLTVLARDGRPDRAPQPYAVDLGRVAAFLLIDVQEAIRRRDAQTARESLVLLSRLGGVLSEEPCTAGFHVQMSIALQTLQALSAAIGGGALRDDDFDQLDAAFLRWTSATPAAALRGEFLAVMQMLEPSSAGELHRMLTAPLSTRKRDYDYYARCVRAYHFTSFLGRPDRLEEQLRCVSDYREAMLWIGRRERPRWDGGKEPPPSRPRTFSLPGGDLNYRCRLLASAWDRLDAASFIARTALRVDQYRRSRRSLPVNLHQAFEATSPLSLQPQDWLAGFPVDYRRTSDGFSLVDPNLADGDVPLRMVVKFAAASEPPPRKEVKRPAPGS